MENKLRGAKEEPTQEAKAPAREKGKVVRKLIQKFDMSGYITKEYAVELLPFIIFLGFLGILYISNTYYAEKTTRKIDKINNELKELRSEYITSKSDLMFKSKQSEVAKTVELMELKESVVPPKIIILKKDTIK